jgi:hypothetical protein
MGQNRNYAGFAVFRCVVWDGINGEMRQKKIFISQKISGFCSFLGQYTICTDRHYTSGRNSNPCTNAFLSLPAVLREHKLFPLCRAVQQMA